MKLFVQARKDGYNVLYPKPTPAEFFQFAGDIRPDSTDLNSIGKKIYTIAFTNGGCIFTKHVIIQDVQRQGLGNIGISVFIPNDRKLPGSDVIQMLDELSNSYCELYCPDYYLGNKQEDWSLFEAITNKYKSRLNYLSTDDVENYQQGSCEAAFIYYLNKIELCKYFDSPFQEEYSPYKQVFYVEKNLEGKSENPLNALRHDPNANLTGEVDLENPKYKLIYNQQRGGVKIEVKVNGSLRNSGNKIKRKEDIAITWSKPYCETKLMKGKWFEIGEEFLIINDIEKTITVKNIELAPIKYNFKFEIKDDHFTPITDAEVILKDYNNLNEFKAKNNEINLTALQLQNKFFVFAKKGNLISLQREIRIEDAKGYIVLTLQKCKTVEINVQNENGRKIDCRIIINNKSDKINIIDNNKIEFIGEAINSYCDIDILSSEYENKTIGFYPKSQDEPILLTLKKKKYYPKEKKYYIKIDNKKGKRRTKGEEIQEDTRSIPLFKCDTRFGYKFIEWKRQEIPNYKTHYDGYYEAIFEKLWFYKIHNWALGLFAVLITLAITFIIFERFGSSGSDDLGIDSDVSNKINSYLRGIELNKDTLEMYKSNYCNISNLPINNAPAKSLWQRIWQRIWPFGAKEKVSTLQDITNLPDFCSKIDYAFAIRNAINLGKIDELKGQIFSESQHNFKNAIDSIEDEYKKQIGDTLNAKKVSLMDLNQIAVLILKTQNDLREKESAIQKEEVPKKNTNEDKKNDPQKKKQINIADSLDKEFWDLVNSGNAQMDSYSNLLKKHTKKRGDIIEYLKKICKNYDSFKKFKDIPEKDRKSATTLTEIDIN